MYKKSNDTEFQAVNNLNIKLMNKKRNVFIRTDNINILLINGNKNK